MPPIITNPIKGTEPSKNKQYQFVCIDNHIFVLHDYGYVGYFRHGKHRWNVWEVTSDGHLIDNDGYLSEEDITSVLDISDTRTYIDTTHLRQLSSGYLDFINHYEQLKIDYFINNL